MWMLSDFLAFTNFSEGSKGSVGKVGEQPSLSESLVWVAQESNALPPACPGVSGDPEVDDRRLKENRRRSAF